MPYDGDLDHPVIERPWEYDIVSLCYQNDRKDARASYVDLTLIRGDAVRRLRFLAPQDFAIEKGRFPEPTRGMCILDVRERQWDGIGVRVADLESTPGAVTFCAREVIDPRDFTVEERR